MLGLMFNLRVYSTAYAHEHEFCLTNFGLIEKVDYCSTKVNFQLADFLISDFPKVQLAYATCPNCNGKGYYFIELLKQPVKVQCDKCNGTGKIYYNNSPNNNKQLKKCPYCNGSGQCGLCNGRGSYSKWSDGILIQNPCEWCRATGRCAYCEGRGKR